MLAFLTMFVIDICIKVIHLRSY